MAQPPDTLIDASPEEAAHIRDAVRNVTAVEVPYGAYRPVDSTDARALFQLLSDPRVSGPLYTVPTPVTEAWVQDWIALHAREAAEGAGLLMLACNELGALTGFVDLQVWPERASAEFGGAIAPDLQSASMGTRGAASLFDWLFQEIGIRLIVMTNALDNMRTEKLLAHLGFERLSNRMCKGPDGTERPSMYWELKRENWRSPF